MTDGWGSILDDGETVIWQGRPDPGWVYTKQMLIAGAIGILFAFVGLRSTLKHANEMGFSVFSLFPLALCLAGLYIALNAVFGSVIRRRYSTYTLTTKRAFIATDIPLMGRRLADHPINATTNIAYEDGVFPSIYFANGPKRRRTIGFERIADGADVLQTMQTLQRDTP